MPTAKPRYDGDGSWKCRQFNLEEWESLKVNIQQQLRPYYPDKNAAEDRYFGHQADGWANHLLAEANSAVSMMLWLRTRLTNEELRNERLDLLKTLEAATRKLEALSHDLNILLGFDADVPGCSDRIKELIPYLQNAEARIAELPKAKRVAEAQHYAAVEMAINVLRILKNDGIHPAETADADLGYVSDAVRILKILGDGIGLVMAETTWKGVIKKAKESAPPPSSNRACSFPAHGFPMFFTPRHAPILPAKR